MSSVMLPIKPPGSTDAQSLWSFLFDHSFIEMLALGFTACLCSLHAWWLQHPSRRLIQKHGLVVSWSSLLSSSFHLSHFSHYWSSHYFQILDWNFPFFHHLLSFKHMSSRLNSANSLTFWGLPVINSTSFIFIYMHSVVYHYGITTTHLLNHSTLSFLSLSSILT